MPYEGQRASKTGHADFFKAELEDFLGHCQYLKKLSANEISLIPSYTERFLPGSNDYQSLWASDGSRYVASVQDGAPTTRIGYVKVSHIGFKFQDYFNLLPQNSRFTDPFAMAKLRGAIRTCVWMLPGSNVQYKGSFTSKDGFRLRLHELMSGTYSNESKSDPLYHSLIRLRGYSQKNKIDTLHTLHIKECPSCFHRHESHGLSFNFSDTQLPCAHCNQPIYASDVLGFHKEFEEFGSNEGLYTRIMSSLEAILMAQCWFGYAHHPEQVEDVIFFYDGALGVYGESSWLAPGLLKSYLAVKEELLKNHKKPPLVVGISKTGQMVKHAEAISSELMAYDLLPVSLDYRRLLMRQFVDDPHRPFFESRWGQEFVWRSPNGLPVVFSLPFHTSDFSQKESIHKSVHYPELPTVLAALVQMESALFPSAFIPIVLAHEEASIAWEPGGRLLTEATKKALLAGYEPN